MIISTVDFLITFIREYSVVCFFVMLFGVGSIILLKQDKKGILTRKLSIGVAFIIVITLLTYIFISYINPNYTCLGYSTKNFQVLKQEENVLACIDDFGSSDGKFSSHTICRLQGLNLNDGKLLYQKSSKNYNDIIGYQNSIVWIQSNYKKLDLKGFDLKNGTVQITMDDDYLMTKFSDLATGIYSCKYNSETELFDVVSKDAKHISIDALTTKKADSAIVKVNQSIHYLVTENEIKDVFINIKSKNETLIKRQHLDSIRDKQLKSNFTYAELDAEYEKLPDNAYKQFSESFISLRGEERRKLYDQDGVQLNKDLDFLKARFVLYDSLTKNVFILSYKTLDKLEFTINCLSSTTGKLIWAAGKNDLKIGDFFTENPKYITALIYNHNAIFVFDGFVISLNKDNGAFNWLKRM
ncbi:MAG: hypothetical protein H0U95_07285 [Bacteroidetes bacterium]|nr:hypothetical protein [Bacteroidota bacterium]